MDDVITVSGLQVARVEFAAYRDQIGELRIRAWKNEYGIDHAFFSRQKWIDEIDEQPNVHHWIALDGERVAAAGRLSLHSSFEEVPYGDFLNERPLSSFGGLPVASINRLVVDPDYRGKGLARTLDELRIEFVSSRGADIITAQPMEERVGALTRLGFEMITQIHSPFQIPGRRIYFMIKQLNRE